jgi:hypothetical protein
VDTPNTGLKRDEVEALIGEVGRFVVRSIAPLVTQPEVPLTPAQLDQLADQAVSVGLLNLSSEAGAGLWENLADASGLSFSVEALIRLAEADTTVAWHFHQLAFGRRLALRLELPELLDDGLVFASTQGHYGLGRMALPRYLAGAELTASDQTLLQDTFAPLSPEARFVLHAQEDWRWLLAPEFDGEQINWRVLAPADVICEHQLHSHGLDGIPCLTWQATTTDGRRTQLDTVAARNLFAEALQLNNLAIVAITLGAVKAAYRLARDYAAIRQQGGTTIDRHPAVRLMLAEINSATEAAAAMLRFLAQTPLAQAGTGQILAARCSLQPQLSRAATAAMQVMGGMGYMRDAGVEKRLRDANQLRLMNGTPTELRLFVAEWERLQ